MDLMVHGDSLSLALDQAREPTACEAQLRTAPDPLRSVRSRLESVSRRPRSQFRGIFLHIGAWHCVNAEPVSAEACSLGGALHRFCVYYAKTNYALTFQFE
jgi:hypothetical protein